MKSLLHKSIKSGFTFVELSDHTDGLFLSMDNIQQRGVGTRGGKGAAALLIFLNLCIKDPFLPHQYSRILSSLPYQYLKPSYAPEVEIDFFFKDKSDIWRNFFVFIKNSFKKIKTLVALGKGSEGL